MFCLVTGPWLVHQHSPGAALSSSVISKALIAQKEQKRWPLSSSTQYPCPPYFLPHLDKKKTIKHASAYCWHSIDLTQGCKLELQGPSKAYFVPCPWCHCLESQLPTAPRKDRWATETNLLLLPADTFSKRSASSLTLWSSFYTSTRDPQPRKRGWWKNGSSLKTRLCSSVYPPDTRWYPKAHNSQGTNTSLYLSSSSENTCLCPFSLPYP